ncbi:hypothetical protein EDD21DRAFT_240329 [Dissophora ornata]|nr:hypothetical protein EDD21DRAFT_240329 [Dissophora ornata]
MIKSLAFKNTIPTAIWMWITRIVYCMICRVFCFLLCSFFHVALCLRYSCVQKVRGTRRIWHRDDVLRMKTLVVIYYSLRSLQRSIHRTLLLIIRRLLLSTFRILLYVLALYRQRQAENPRRLPSNR